ncbi:Histone-Lysine N-Methyltransferase ash1l [Podila verticillata]|nr:Histone-Lysine N-Methyltransferase ash1l [Podila verticillata]
MPSETSNGPTSEGDTMPDQDIKLGNPSLKDQEMRPVATTDARQADHTPSAPTPSEASALSAASTPTSTNAYSTPTPTPTPAPGPQKKRGPGRPPGYFLGPISCAYCRQQHRRCDYNQVCHRCIKANIPCDRTGTVERPSVIVRAAKAAKAAAAAAAAAAQRDADIAAGVYVAPVPKKKDIPVREESPPKRKRPLGVSGIVPDNIIEERSKRATANAPIQRFDPMAFKLSRQKKGTRSPSATPRPEDDMDMDDDYGVGPSTAPTRSRVSSRIQPPPPPPVPAPAQAPAPTKSKPRQGSQAPLSKPSKPVIRTGRANVQTKQTKTSVIPAANRKQTKRGINADASDSDKSIQAKPVKRVRLTLQQNGSSTPAEEEEPQTNGSSAPVQLVKKSYLKSGLYSADLKLDPHKRLVKVTFGKNKMQEVKPVAPVKPVITTTRSGRVTGTAAAIAAATAKPPKVGKPSFFQLPINYGAVLMSRQRDFQLPFDIVQAWKVGVLQKRREPEPFTKIRANIFVERKRRIETSPMVCHCVRPPPGSGRIGCGEDCYNRVMFYECIPSLCPCGDQCSNQRFQHKHNEDNLRVIWTPQRGFGIKTTEPIKKGSLVIEYRGEVISQKLCLERMATIYKKNKNFYFLEYEKGEVVDACQKGTNARFVNHSCSPNSQIEKWLLNGEMSIGIFASQDIPSGAEISYDYNFSPFSGAQKQKCRCEALNCRGFIGERGPTKTKSAGEVVPQQQASASKSRKAKNGKRKAKRIDDVQPTSVRYGHLPSLIQIRPRPSEKYNEKKTKVIRERRLLMFRCIRNVASKYAKYAQTKSRSYQETASKAMLLQIKECRKRSLEGVADDLRRTAIESQVIDLTATTEEVVRNDFEEEEEVDDLESTLDQGTPTNSSAMDEEIYQLISDDEARETPETIEVQDTPETHEVEVEEDDEYQESERVFARVKQECAHEESEPEEDELEEDDDEVPSVRESVVSVQKGMNGSLVDPGLVAIKEEAVEYSLATWSTGFASKIADSSRRRS